MRVARIGLAVVKGTRHQACDEVALSPSGPVGDRLFCLVDPLRRQVLKTVANARLIGVTSTWRDNVLTVGLGGRSVRGEPRATGETLNVSYWGRPISVEVVSGPWSEPFSQLLGQRVVLARARTGDLVYGAPISLVTTGALADLGVVRRDGPRGPEPLELDLDSARFRATFVLDTAAGPGHRPGGEQVGVGHELLLGSARVRLTAPILRCGVVDFHPDSGNRDLRLLDALPRGHDGEPVFGLQGEVVEPGLVERGATVLVARRSGRPAP